MVALFVFKMNKILNGQISTLRKRDCFLVKVECVYPISSVYYLICLILKKQNTPQDAAWKALQFTKNNLWKDEIEKTEFVFYQKNHLIFIMSKFGRSEFFHFENKKCNYKISGLVQIVELFTLHLVVYFVFLIWCVKW